jgi:hypothetical protein
MLPMKSLDSFYWPFEGSATQQLKKQAVLTISPSLSEIMKVSNLISRQL